MTRHDQRQGVRHDLLGLLAVIGICFALVFMREVVWNWGYDAGVEACVMDADDQFIELIAWQMLADRLGQGEEPTEVGQTARRPTGIVTSPPLPCGHPIYWRVLDGHMPGKTHWDSLPVDACEFVERYDTQAGRNVLVFLSCDHLGPLEPC